MTTGTVHPGGLEDIIFENEGAKLIGALYLAAGPGDKPTALVLHGIPGTEKNTDYAYALRERGWNACIFHYRGSWGSGGRYDMRGIPSDVRAAMDYLRSGAWPVDANRLALIGFSLGAWAAVTVAALDTRVKAAVSLAGPGEIVASFLQPLAENWARFLTGVTAQDLVDQWAAIGREYNPVNLVAHIAPRPLLIVHGSRDEAFPVEQAALLYSRAGEGRELYVVPEADHVFTHHRREVVEKVVGWVVRKVV